jgi:hypothetical protein
MTTARVPVHRAVTPKDIKKVTVFENYLFSSSILKQISHYFILDDRNLVLTKTVVWNG